MSHKLVSNKEVVYDAYSLSTGFLTIFCNTVNFNILPNNDIKHLVGINGRLFANFIPLSGGTYLNTFNYQLTEEQWDAFYDSQTFTTTDPFDKIMECGLYYIQSQLSTMYGLTQSDWIFEQ